VTALLGAIAAAWLYGGTLSALVTEWLSSADASYGLVVFAVAIVVAWQRRDAVVRACSAKALAERSAAPTRRAKAFALRYTHTENAVVEHDATSVNTLPSTQSPQRPQRETDFGGLALVVAALLLYLAGVLGADIFTVRVSFVVLVTGAIWYVAGRAAARLLAVPLLFLLIAIPLPALIVNAITLPLQLVASRLAEGVLAAAGVPVFRDGNLLVLPSATLEVEQACSGLRSLVSLGALSIVLAWATETSVSRRMLIAAASLPIAIVANGLRIAATGMAVEAWGPQMSVGAWHTLTGWLTFVAAVAALIGAQRMLHAIATHRHEWTPGEVAA
jgi:exosortase